MNKWNPEIENVLPKAKRMKAWEESHRENNYNDVYSVTEDFELRRKIVSYLNQIPELKKVAIPGCGTKTMLQEDISYKFDQLRIFCSDFKFVVDIPKEKNTASNIHYLSADTSDLPYKNEMDAIVVVNSILSPSHQENVEMVTSCYNALTGKGTLIGLFPTLFCGLEIDSLGEFKKNQFEFDLSNSAFREGGIHDWQIFYTPLRLRKLLTSCGFKKIHYEIVFLDSPHSLKEQEKIYGIENVDSCIYEILVTATKQ